MLYGKLIVVALGTIASEPRGSANQVIAQYIMEHLQEIHQISLAQLARACRVGTGSVSRFCREIGLENFAELKELLTTVEPTLEVSRAEGFYQRVLEYQCQAQNSIAQAACLLSEEAIEALCRDIQRYQRVAAFGMLRSESVALNFQGSMVSQGKYVFTTLTYKQQIDYIEQATEKDLILIFSNEGVYFEYQYGDTLPPQLKAPKIYLITSSEQKTFSPCIDGVIRFQSDHWHCRHPYQMQFVADLIAAEYARLAGGKDSLPTSGKK